MGYIEKKTCPKSTDQNAQKKGKEEKSLSQSVGMERQDYDTMDTLNSNCHYPIVFI